MTQAFIHDGITGKNKCDDCNKMRPDVEMYQYPGGAMAQLCDDCAQEAGFILEIS